MAVIDITCEVCGQIVSLRRSPSQLIKQPPRFCSRKCHAQAQKGEGNPSFCGGRHLLTNGYVVILFPDHPGADARGYVYEHRLVMENSMGRPLPRGSVVHHKNGIKTDNAIENLELISSHSDHMREHYAGRPLIAPRGEHHGMAKLSDRAVSEIRIRHETGESGKAIAARFGMSRSQISNILNRRQRNGY